MFTELQYLQLQEYNILNKMILTAEEIKRIKLQLFNMTMLSQLFEKAASRKPGPLWLDNPLLFNFKIIQRVESEAQFLC